MKPKQQPQPVDLSKFGLRSHPGLKESWIVEFQQLNCGNVGSLMAACDVYQGDLTQMSTAAVVVEPDQSEATGLWLLSHPNVPENWKKQWDAYKDPKTEQPTAVKTADLVIQARDTAGGFFGSLFRAATLQS